MNKKGLLIVISGFSGAGKGTIVKRLIKDYGYSLSISATTREPRDGEENGREYYFKTREEFQNLIDYNGFIEWAQYVENYYGTPRAFVEKEMELGHNVILEIEVQGALNIKRQYPKALLLFITTKNAEILKERLIGRGTEDEKTIEKRLKRASKEAEDMNNYEYIVVNNDLDECVKTVHSIIESEICKISYNKEFVEQIKNELQGL